jgi:hypothetical protein
MSFTRGIKKPKNGYKSDKDCQMADDGKTQAQFAKGLDPHNIVNRMLEPKPGIVMPNHNPTWDNDLVNNLDFETAQNAIATQKAIFEQMPPEIRNQCGNNPANLLGYLEDPANLEVLKAHNIDVTHLEERITPEPAPEPEPAPAPAPEPEPAP